MSYDDRRARAERGIRAQQLMENEILVEAFQNADAKCVAEWRDAETVEDREKAWARAQAIAAVREELWLIVADGQQAQAGMDVRGEQ